MAKLTKTQLNHLWIVRRNLLRGIEFINSDRTVVATRKAMATTTIDYSRPDGDAIAAINKQYGSDLTGLQSALDYLDDFLKANAYEGN